MRRAKAEEPRALGARVDWLELAFRVDLDPRVVDHLKRSSARTVRHDCAVPIVLRDGTACSLAVQGRAGKWCLQNGSLRLTVLEKAPGAEGGAPGWGVRVEFSGTELFALGTDAAVRLAWSVAGALGTIDEARFGRTDLCVDVAHYGLSPEDRAHFVKQRRVKLQPFANDGAPVRTSYASVGMRGEEIRREGTKWRLDGRRVVAFLRDEEGGMCAEYYGGDTFTGYGFGSRTSVSARIYDKRHELRTNPERREAEENGWRAHGWTGKGDVARVEFELRGEALDELRLRHAVRADVGPEGHAARFRAALDGAWAYCSRKWLRLGKRGERDYVQPRWRVVQEATFVGPSGPRERVRVRGAAKAAQAAGSCVSLLGAVKRLRPGAWLAKASPRTGEVDEWRAGEDERVLVDEFLARSLDPDTRALAERQLASEWAEIGAEAAREVVAYERERAGGDARAALERLWAKKRATHARYLQAPLPAVFVSLARAC